MLGVDFADYAKALSQGGEIRVWSTRGQDGAESVSYTHLDVYKRQLHKSVDDAISRVRGKFALDGFASTEAAIDSVRDVVEPAGQD